MKKRMKRVLAAAMMSVCTLAMAGSTWAEDIPKKAVTYLKFQGKWRMYHSITNKIKKGKIISSEEGYYYYYQTPITHFSRTTVKYKNGKKSAGKLYYGDNSLASKITYQYKNGRLVKEKYKSTDSVTSSYSITYTYRKGRLISMTNDGAKTAYSYDKKGRLIKEKSSDTTITYSNFDKYNHPKKIKKVVKDSDGVRTYTITVKYSYDKKGRLIKSEQLKNNFGGREKTVYTY